MNLSPQRRRVLRMIFVGAVLALVWFGRAREATRPDGGETPSRGSAAVEELHARGVSNRIVQVEGMVDRVLSDDREGSRHQRFVLRLPSGHTLLVAHNIDLAQRVPLERGDRVEALGEYEWNDRGGVLHWTHHDPQGRHEGGWILHAGRRYE